MFSGFFIDRPIFAAVLSIIITIAGAVALRNLPVAQYPEIAPPTVEVSAIYPGANAQVVADTVAAPLEQRVNGVEGMLYVSSQCTNDGSYVLTVTFRVGVDLNMAQVLVQNRVALAEAVLPELVKRRGVTVKKKATNVLLMVNLFSPDGSRDNLYLSNYATIQLRDELARLPGVGDINVLGQRDYSMRIWLEPEKLAMRRLTANDVIRALEQQNVQVAAGQIGQPPVPQGQAFQLAMSTLGRLSSPEQFGNVILKSDGRGRVVHLSDVARVELGAQAYDQSCSYDGRPSVALSIYQLPGSNALATAQRVKEKMVELKERFPEGVDYQVVYDTTPFIEESINEVYKTLRDAVILVAIVMLVFLQSWRSALIPLVAVPVAIIGTFAAMAAFGFSVNNLTLFGLVLAIGIVVDDAIVVVEAVEQHLERGLEPRAAALQAMHDVAGPVIAIGLVLSAVFVPCAFIGGISGQFFRQFALTIGISTLISAFNSLTLSPALAALLLKPHHGKRREVMPHWAYLLVGGAIGYFWLEPVVRNAVNALAPYLDEMVSQWLIANTTWISVTLAALALWVVATPLDYVLGVLFRGFNTGFHHATRGYVWLVGRVLRVAVIGLIVYAGLLGATWWQFTTVPTGFIPSQDKGFLLVNVQLPDAASVERTEQSIQRIEAATREVKGVKHVIAIAGHSLLLNANAPHLGSMYVVLDEFKDRRDPELLGDNLARHLQSVLQEEFLEANVNVFGAPPVDGLGTAGGFKIVIEDRSDQGLAELQDVAHAIVEDGNRDSRELQGLFTSYRADAPWIELSIDRVQAQVKGVQIGEVFNTLQVNLGSLYVNDFNRFGRTWQVNVQADARFRQQIDVLKRLRVRNFRGDMVPLGSIMHVREVQGPSLLTRYNLYQAAAINGAPAEGVSSGAAMATMEELTRSKLSEGMRSEWTELAFLQSELGATAAFAFGMAVVFVFLVLAAQYESWILPLAVILVVPTCLLSAVIGLNLASMDVNVFTQVGLVVLVGLACKNAILIVEFAKTHRDEGMKVRQATLEACRIRIRPIMMTSLAFILGVVPLVIAQGAGAEMRRTLGTAVFAGMLGVTFFGIFLTPVFYYVLQTGVQVVQRWRGNGADAGKTTVGAP